MPVIAGRLVGEAEHDADAAIVAVRLARHLAGDVDGTEVAAGRVDLQRHGSAEVELLGRPDEGAFLVEVAREVEAPAPRRGVRDLETDGQPPPIAHVEQPAADVAVEVVDLGRLAGRELDAHAGARARVPRGAPPLDVAMQEDAWTGLE